MASINTATLSLGDVFTTRHGAEIASIRDGKGDLVIQPEEILRVPFEPSAYSESETHRLTMLLEASRPLLEVFAELDEWLIGYLIEHSSRVFKKPLTADQIRSSYSSCIRHSDKGYAPTLKTKVDLSDGKHALHCWDDDGNQVPSPECWRNCWISPRLHVTHLWMMGPSFGPVIRLTDALLRPDEGAAPAERSSPF